MKVNVIDGDITQVKAATLVTAINSGGAWWGGVDGAIQRSSGNMFHSQAAAAMPLQDGQVIFAKPTGTHNGQFESVTFVVDELQLTVSDLVMAALNEAEKRALISVSFPTMRTGVMAGVHESRTQALTELAKTIGNFAKDGHPSSIEEINIVVYNSDGDVKLLQDTLG